MQLKFFSFSYRITNLKEIIRKKTTYINGYNLQLGTTCTLLRLHVCILAAVDHVFFYKCGSRVFYFGQFLQFGKFQILGNLKFAKFLPKT